MESLYLVRHGQTHWNAQQRMQGRLDSPLTEAGQGHARANADWLVREGIDGLLASPLGRTRATAAIVAGRLGVDVEYDDRLMERHCGIWEGLTLADIERRWPEEHLAWRADPFFFRPPGGENLPDMIARVAPLLDQLTGRGQARVVIVSHGMLGRAMLTHLLALAPDVASTARQPNDLVYRLRFAGERPNCEHYRGGVGPTAGLFNPPPS